MKRAITIVCFLFICASLHAEYSVGQLIDGLNSLTSSLDSGKQPTPDQSRQMQQALDYLAGFSDSMRSIGRNEKFGGGDLKNEQKIVDYQKLPKSVAPIARDVILYYHDLHFLRDRSAGDFLLSYFLSNYGVSDLVKARGTGVVEQMVIFSISDLLENPTASSAFKRRFSQLEKLDSNNLKDLSTIERRYFDITKEALKKDTPNVTSKEQSFAGVYKYTLPPENLYPGTETIILSCDGAFRYNMALARGRSAAFLGTWSYSKNRVIAVTNERFVEGKPYPPSDNAVRELGISI
jgi:hypothetical protein